ncbi:MAG: thymidylate synthase [Kamptonema sp. SIO1D9]|nr:thymidylate synthase [Kamptonema sp. SIO1D9]
MRQYLDLLRTILNQGIPRDDRTGVGTRAIFGHTMRFDLAEGFPLLTTKKVNLKSIIHELLWFIQGSTNTKYLNAQGVHIWDDCATNDGELGPIYGEQWRGWLNRDGERIDQLNHVIELLKLRPTSRRLLVSAWNVGDLSAMSLPPCSPFFQLWAAEGRLSCMMYQRSGDVFLGVPFDIASHSLLTMMIAQVVGLRPGHFIHVLADVHLYNTHIEQAKLQLTREPRALPRMLLNPAVSSIDEFRFEDFELVDYNPHPRIQAPRTKVV